jgi:hypothetical protein
MGDDGVNVNNLGSSGAEEAGRALELAGSMDVFYMFH